MISYSEFIHKSPIEYLSDYTDDLSSDFSVSLNGKEIPCYTCRISKHPFNRPWPGHQRELEQTELASFVNIVADEEVSLSVKINKKYEKIMIRPFSKNVEFKDENGTVTFNLNEGQYVFATDNLHSPLFIFVTKPIICENPDSVTYYFGPGVHFPGKITLKDNETVYADKDAHVFGAIYANGAKNIKIYGNGLFDDSFEERFSAPCYSEYTNGNVKFYNCENVSVEGVLFKDSAIWCVNLFHCFNVSIDNIKVFGQWRYNTDGIDIVNSRDILIKSSFIHSFDDTITIKGILAYKDTNNENIVTDGCVIWCDWGKALEIGIETACKENKNIIFRNTDIIRGGNTYLDIQNGAYSETHHILFENINAEYNSFDTRPEFHIADGDFYTKENEKFVPSLIYIQNHRFIRDFLENGKWGLKAPWCYAEPLDEPLVDVSDIEFSTNHHIFFKNINVYYDEKIEKVDGKYNVPIRITSKLQDIRHYDIEIDNLSINGEKIEEKDVLLFIENSEKVIIK